MDRTVCVDESGRGALPPTCEFLHLQIYINVMTGLMITCKWLMAVLYAARLSDVI